jgi:signal transduction histidine kinase
MSEVGGGQGPGAVPGVPDPLPGGPGPLGAPGGFSDLAIPGHPDALGDPQVPTVARLSPSIGTDGPSVEGSLLHDRRLWVTAGLIAVLASGWLVAALMVGHPLSGNTLAFLPLGVFLIPVLYASVTFGLGGGMFLAILSAAATIPWALASLSRQDTLGAWSDLVQAVVLVLVAYFVGRAVRAERLAREVAEASRLDHLLAEVRYRDLFETNSAPIVIADGRGLVHETNLAADELFSRWPVGSGVTLADLLGTEVAGALLTGGTDSPMVEIGPELEGTPAVYRPTGRVVDIDGEEMYQVVLQDVTEDARRRQRVQAYAADVLRGQEDERRRIAQELHDGPLQRLVHLCRQIDAAAGRAVRKPPSDRGDPGTLGELRETTESVIGEVRRIARGLRPPLLDDLGLKAALERLCDDAELRAGVATSLRVEGGFPPLSAPAELTVYRIVQEALSNVDRHAEASTVSIRFWVEGAWLQLRVADDGLGFDSAEQASRRDGGKLGMVGMTERAELVGGKLRVASRPGGGTTVGAAIPIEVSAPDLRTAPPPAAPAPAVPPPTARTENAPSPVAGAPIAPSPAAPGAMPAAPSTGPLDEPPSPAPTPAPNGIGEPAGPTVGGAYPLRR